MEHRNWIETTADGVYPLLEGFERWVDRIGAVTESVYVYTNSKKSISRRVIDRGCLLERKQQGRLLALREKRGFKRLAEKLASLNANPVCIVILSGPKIERAHVIVKPLQHEKHEYDIAKKLGDLDVGPKIYASYKNKGVQMLVEEGLSIERLWLPLYAIKKLPAVQFSRRIGELFGKLHHTGIIYQDWQPNHVFYQVPSGRRLGKAKLIDFGSAAPASAKFCNKERSALRRTMEDLLKARGISNKESLKSLSQFDAAYEKKR